MEKLIRTITKKEKQIRNYKNVSVQNWLKPILHNIELVGDS